MAQYVKQSTAKTFEFGPFLDSTDGNTEKTGLSLAASDILVSKNGAALTAKSSSTAPTGGTNGHYQVTLDTTDTGTLGPLRVYAHKATSLAVWQDFIVVPANVYDSLVSGSSTLTSNVTQWNSSNVATPDTAGYPKITVKAGTGTGEVSLSSGAVTVGTNNDKTGYGLSSAAVQAIWDALTSALTTVGSIGKKLADWVIGTTQTGDAYARLGAPAGASVSADIASIKTDTGTTIPGRLPASLVSGRMDSSVGAYQSGQTPLQPTVAGRTLDVTTTGEAGIDWANIGAPTTSQNLSGTTISTSQAVASVSGAVGSVTGAVGSVTGNVGGNVVGSVASVTAAVAITSNIKKNQALSGFEFMMTDSTNHAPATGKTVTVTRSIDGGTFASGALSAVTEVASGIYKVDFAAGDLNGNVITLRATATACDDTFERIVTQP